MALSDINTKKSKEILFATILASGTMGLQISTVRIALPVIQFQFHTSITTAEWVVNSYTLVLASLLLLSGSLGDHIGRKKVFCIGLIIFIIASCLSVLAPTIGILIAFQILLGLGAALAIPESLAIINSSIEADERGRAMGIWSGFSAAVVALGPFVGGFLVQLFGWPAIFLLNIPLGLASLYLAIKHIPESKNPHAKSIDILGTTILTIGLLGVVYALMHGQELGWTHPMIIAGWLVGAIFFCIFIAAERVSKDPLVPLHIFRSPLVSGANLVTLFLYFALNGTIFFLVLNFQQIQSYSPSFAGIALLPVIIIISIFSGFSGSLADKFGPRWQMIIGPLLVGIGMLLLSFAGANAEYFTSFFPGLVLFGTGMSLVIAPLTKSALSVKEEFSGAASGINNAVSRIAALLSVALLGSVLLAQFSKNLDSEIATTALSASQKKQILIQVTKVGGIEIPKSFDVQAKTVADTVIKDSFIQGFHVVMSINATLAFLAAACSFFLIKNKKSF